MPRFPGHSQRFGPPHCRWLDNWNSPAIGKNTSKRLGDWMHSGRPSPSKIRLYNVIWALANPQHQVWLVITPDLTCLKQIPSLNLYSIFAKDLGVPKSQRSEITTWKYPTKWMYGSTPGILRIRRAVSNPQVWEVLVGSNIDCPDPKKERGMDQVKNRFKAIVIMPTLQVINSVD